MTELERQLAVEFMDEGMKPLAVAEVLMFRRHLERHERFTFQSTKHTHEYKEQLMSLYKEIENMDKCNYAPRPDRPDVWQQ